METTNYMLLGFVVIFGVLFLHLASFFLRNRNLRRDLEMLQQLEKRSARKPGVRKKKGSRR